MKKALILNLEDIPYDAELNAETLASDGIACEVVRVETRGDFVAAITGGAFDVILADYSLPTFDGLTALALACERCPEVPFIFVSGALGEEAAIEALKEGATDYVLKNKLSRLAPAVRRALTERDERVARKRADERLRRMNRELRAISDCNQVLVRAVDEQTLLDSICRIVCDEAGYRMAWVGYAEHDEAKSVKPVAWGGVNEGYLAEARITWADTERGRGPTGIAIRTGQSSCIQDFTTDASASPWRENAVQRGYRSAIALPLKDEQTSLFGALMIYSTEANAFTPDEVRLLEDLSGDLSFGITVLRARGEQKRIEDALRESEGRLRAMFEQHHTVMVLVDPEFGAILDANAAAERFYGYPLSTLRRMRVADLHTLPEEEVTRLRQEIIQGRLDSFVTAHRLASGEIRTVDVHSSPFVSRGKTTLLSIVTDITERVEAEKTRRLLSATVESSDDAIISKDLTGKILTWNRGAERMYGYSAAEAVGQLVAFLVPPDRPDELPGFMARLKNGEIVEHFETERMRKDGVRIPVSLAISPLRDAGGTIIGASSIARDISERKRIEVERLDQLRFFESLDEINRAIQGANSLDEMMSDTLDAVLSVFNCDRAWLVYPCDPKAAFWHVPMERTRPEYPGAFSVGTVIPMNPEISAVLHTIADSSGVVEFGPGAENPLPEETARRFNIQSQITLMLHPKVDKPWVFGIHQCSHPRDWTRWEERLLVEIGRRMSDSLTSLLAYRNLRESAETLDAITASAQDAVIMMDNSGRIVFWNPAAERMFGYSAAEARGHDLHMLLAPPHYHNEYCRALGPFRENGSGPMIGKTIDLVALRKGGVEFEMELSLSSVRQNNEWKAVGIVRDVTDRKRAERALRESEEQYRLLVENADEAIFVVQNNAIAFPNRKTEALSGYTAGELTGMPFPNLVFYEDRAAVARHYEKLLRGERASPSPSFRLQADGGGIVWVQIAAARISWSGAPAALCFLKDITEQKALESQFMQAQKMEAVGRLAGGVAHDFNNMIGAILGHCELILGDTREGDPLRLDVIRIRECAERSATLTRQLLAFSRRQALAPEVFDLNEVLAGFRSVLARLIGEDIDLQIVPGPSLGFVRADRGQVEQIIMNLAVNARDAMPAGGKLTIETANVELDEDYAQTHVGGVPGPHVMLAVTDTGIGMDQETMQRVFEPFFTTKDPGKGTGLGLATVYGIVKQSGGSIWVDTQPGHGTVFRLYLPRVDEAPTVAAPCVQPAALEGGETILVVEDEDALRNLVVRTLQRRGYKVLTAKNGSDALQVCERSGGGIDLLVTDVVMPGMGGHALARRLAEIFGEMRVLYMSGYTDDSIVHNGVLDEGANFIQKPFSSAGLLAKIRDVLQRNPGKS